MTKATVTAPFATDIWVLDAIVETSRNGSVDIETLLDAVDSTHRWVPGYGQLNWSLSRLLARALISVSTFDGVTRLERTPAARKLSYQERSTAAPRRFREDVRLPADRRVISSAEYLASREAHVPNRRRGRRPVRPNGAKSPRADATKRR